MEEAIKRSDKKAYFVTLTVNDKEFDELRKAAIAEIRKKYEKWDEPVIKKMIEKGLKNDDKPIRIAVKRFRERWRKKYGESIQHWLVTERGHKGTERVHLHGILWQNDVGVKPTMSRKGKEAKSNDEYSRKWKYGYVFTGDRCNNTTANYITKYITKADKKHKEYRARIMCTPGIGKEWITKLNIRDSKEEYEINERKIVRRNNGFLQKMPKYYQEKVWNKEEREEHWLKNIEKPRECRVGGELLKIDTEEKVNILTEMIVQKQQDNGGEPERINSGIRKWNVEKYIADYTRYNFGVEVEDKKGLLKDWEEKERQREEEEARKRIEETANRLKVPEGKLFYTRPDEKYIKNKEFGK